MSVAQQLKDIDLRLTRVEIKLGELDKKLGQIIEIQPKKDNPTVYLRILSLVLTGVFSWLGVLTYLMMRGLILKGG